jgi:hypothetical protein
MSQRTKWKVVAAAIGFSVLLLFGVSVASPWSVRIGKVNFGTRRMEGMTLAPGRIMDGVIERHPSQTVYHWYVKTGKRTLLAFSFTWL